MEQVPARPIKPHANSGSRSSPYHEARKLSISILVISLPVLYVSLLHIPPSTLMKDTTFWFLMSNSIIIIVAADSGMFSASSSPSDDLYDELVRHSRARSAAACSVVESATPLKHFGCAVGQFDDETNLVKDQINGVEQMSSNAQHQSLVVVDKSVLVHENPPKEKVIAKPVVNKRIARKRDKTLALHQKSLSQVERVADPETTDGRKARLRRSATEKSICDEPEVNEYDSLSNEELNKRVEEFIRRFNREMRLQLQNE